MSAPDGWTCVPSYYADGFSCDCECGVADPDCAEPGKPIFNCEVLQTCTPEGVCVGGLEDIPVDPNWNCDPTYWNVNDGCDCACGAYDPDCDREGTLWNCQASQFCNAAGACEDIPVVVTDAPTGPIVTGFPTAAPTTADFVDWTCFAPYYNDGFGCDCDCGTPDPDCDDPDKPVFNCAVLQTCSADGECIGGLEDIPVPDDWTCNPGFFNVNDGCDCACGAYDPDCDLPLSTLFNCGELQFCNLDGDCEDIPVVVTDSPTGPIVTNFPTSSPEAIVTPEPTAVTAPPTVVEFPVNEYFIVVFGIIVGALFGVLAACFFFFGPMKSKKKSAQRPVDSEFEGKKEKGAILATGAPPTM